MGASSRIVFRATRRVALSTAGEVIGRSVNLLIPFALLAIHSANDFTDSFFLAVAIAFFFQGTLANVVINALVPQFVNPGDKLDLVRYSGWASIAAVVSGIVAFIFATQPLSVGSALVAAVSVSVIAGVGLLAAPAVATLIVEHRYGAPGITWGFRLIPLALYLYWQPMSPELHMLLAGIAVSDSVRSILLIRLSNARLTFDRNAPQLEFPQAALYLILASAIAGLNPLLVRLIANSGGSGNVSVFEAADRLFNAILSLATIGLGNVVLVYLSRLAGTQDEHRGWRWIWWATLSWSLLWMTISILVWKFFPIGSLLLPNQNESISEIVRYTFAALAVGIPGFVMTLIYSRRLLTLNRTAALVPIAAAGLACTASVGIALSPSYGTVGTALALSISHYLVALLMRNKVRDIPTGNESARSNIRKSV